MTDELELWLISPELYEKTYLHLNNHDGSVEMPEHFKHDDRFCSTLVPTSFIEREINTFSSKTLVAIRFCSMIVITMFAISPHGA